MSEMLYDAMFGAIHCPAQQPYIILSKYLQLGLFVMLSFVQCKFFPKGAILIPKSLSEKVASETLTARSFVNLS